MGCGEIYLIMRATKYPVKKQIWRPRYSGSAARGTNSFFAAEPLRPRLCQGDVAFSRGELGGIIGVAATWTYDETGHNQQTAISNNLCFHPSRAAHHFFFNWPSCCVVWDESADTVFTTPFARASALLKPHFLSRWSCENRELLQANGKSSYAKI